MTKRLSLIVNPEGGLCVGLLKDNDFNWIEIDTKAEGNAHTFSEQESNRLLDWLEYWGSKK